jgi:hypothetical protein
VLLIGMAGARNGQGLKSIKEGERFSARARSWRDYRLEVGDDDMD